MCMPDRKPLRLLRFDYNSPRYYFVTICTHEKRFFLGRCVGARHDSPTMQLSPYGRVADVAIAWIPARFSHVKVDKYIIMPNHIHLILCIEDGGNVAGAIRESPLRKTGRSTYSQVIGYYKASVSKEIHRRFHNSEPVWQRGSYDHIIRNEEDYLRIWQYIDTNPQKWELDCYHPDKERTT